MPAPSPASGDPRRERLIGLLVLGVAVVLLVSSVTWRPASWQRACSSDRVPTTLPQVSSYHWASAAKRVGMVCRTASVYG